MINRTNQIMELENGKEYFVFRQVVYKKTTYYVTVEVENSGESFKEKMIILQEKDKDGKKIISKINDPEITLKIINSIKD